MNRFTTPESMLAFWPLARPYTLPDVAVWDEISEVPDEIRQRCGILSGEYAVDGGQVMGTLNSDPMAACQANSREWKWEAAGKWMALILRAAEIANEHAPVELGELLHRGKFFDALEPNGATSLRLTS